MITLTIDDQQCTAEAGATILSVAAGHNIYIPSLCSHPDLPPFKDLPLAARVFRGQTCYTNEPLPGNESARRADPGADPPVSTSKAQLEGCGLCVVQVAGLAEPVRACHTPAAPGMAVQTQSEALAELRRASLMKILARHPHACLTCAQREGCSLENCSTNVPREERCCNKFHNCELRKVAEYVGIREDTPRYRPAGLPVLDDEPLLARDFNLCIDCTRCVRVCNQVRGVRALGIVHHQGRLIVGSLAPTLLASACKFCGACAEVCPTGCITDKAARPGPREHWLVPCVHTCPAGVDVPGYVRAVAAGDFGRAAALIWEQLPLANVLAHICFHQCESECRRAQLDDPLAICALKKFVLNAADGRLPAVPVPAAAIGKKVAVVGGGPAGLTAAYFLRLKGHAVTIFEAARSLGGMPAISIPQYRLPPAVLEKDLVAIQSLGVQAITDCRLNSGTAMAQLLRQGFDAVLISVGLPESRKITIPGSELTGVHWGLEFLRAVKAGQTFELGPQVVVVGGGNVAIDVAMTALRLSGGRVRLFCLESRAEMPAYKDEIEKAEAEGIQVNPGWGPTAIKGAAGKVNGVEFRRCLAVFDDKRNFAPVFDDQHITTAPASAVILAIGQTGPQDLPRQQDGVFWAGDITGGPQSVVHAVASGRQAAERIDRYLGGDGELSVQLVDRLTPSAWIDREEGFAPRPRQPIPCASPTERRRDFRPIDGTYSSQAAVAEARRCLQCDLRLMIRPPTSPPQPWLELTPANAQRAPAREGVLILADPNHKPVSIRGTPDIRAAVLAAIESTGSARYFLWEEDRLYTKRESELIEQHLKRYGELPGGALSELDELF